MPHTPASVTLAGGAASGKNGDCPGHWSAATSTPSRNGDCALLHTNTRTDLQLALLPNRRRIALTN